MSSRRLSVVPAAKPPREAFRNSRICGWTLLFCAAAAGDEENSPTPVAGWRTHWSFVPIARPPLPAAGGSSWPRNAIDQFVRARLEQEGLEPSPEADRETLLRRVSIGLVGLPPDLDELDRFLCDSSPAAYEHAVERLLASPHYGEERARYWLDAARYGDTHGLHLDNERMLWRYRDWVIRAFNDNLPFDQFTLEQLAGDLLPGATLEQKIATGFHRCNVTTGEGGLIEEEYLVKYAIDRVETTGTVWMGLTVQCAQCHDHKYDPVSQQDFYRFFAFFNNVAEKGTDENAPSPPPFLKAPSLKQEEQLRALQASLDEVRARRNDPMPEVDARQRLFEEKWTSELARRWTVLSPRELHSTGGSTLSLLDDQSVLVSGPNPAKEILQVTAPCDHERVTALRLEVLPHASHPGAGLSRSQSGNFVLTEVEVEVAPLDRPEQWQKIEWGIASADFSQDGFEAEKAVDGSPETGWAIASRPEPRVLVLAAGNPVAIDGGMLLRLRLRHDSMFEQHIIGRFRVSVSSEEGLLASALSSWRILGPMTAKSGGQAHEKDFGPEATLATEGIDFSKSWQNGRDGQTAPWREKPEFVDGVVQELGGDNSAYYLARKVTSSSDRFMTISLGSDDSIKAWANGELVLDRPGERAAARDQDRITVPLRKGENQLLLKVANYYGAHAYYFKVLGESSSGLPIDVEQVLATAAELRTQPQKDRLREDFRGRHSPQFQELSAKLFSLEKSYRDLYAQVPVTMVMAELEQPRPTHFLNRGQYDQKGDVVSAGTPAFLPPLPADLPADRLALARWLVDKRHPLTARVIVNRIWQEHFGTGLVRTAENFGIQGEKPSHPEVLDWLAAELIDSGFDVKHMHRLIVHSATYRQSSRVTAERLEKDPQNRLQSRGPRFRMDAESIRDLALASSGLLVPRIGGPSVKPYQPPHLWKEIAYPTSSTANFVQDHGEALYRRSLYIFWKRTCPPVQMTLFDAPSRETCTVARARTSTPLQALVLMNDVQFIEAARMLAERILKEAGTSAGARLERAFRIVLSRSPGKEESAVLLKLVEEETTRFQSALDAARLLLSNGEHPRDPTLNEAELAAWTMVANVILNLDEAITRG